MIRSPAFARFSAAAAPRCAAAPAPFRCATLPALLTSAILLLAFGVCGGALAQTPDQTPAQTPAQTPDQTPAPPSAQAPASFSGVTCPPASGTPEDPTYPIRKDAFDADSRGDHDAARHLMRCAIRANAHDLVALRQEVYLDLNAHDEKSAAEDIDALRQQGASTPQFEAQQGYLYAKAKRYDEARADFGRAIEGGDPALRESAMAAIRVLDGEFPRHTLYLASDSQYLNRFNDGITDDTVRYYERLGRRSPFQVYANARLLRDTASAGGALPQIVSDNAFVFGGGLAFQPHGAPYSFTAEGNEAYVFFGSQSGGGAFKPDLRAVASYYRTWQGSQNISGLSQLSFEANGSFGFYSRYGRDGIAYLQPREVYELFPAASLHLRPFFQQSLALDTKRVFYNNSLELIPGFEVSSTRLHSVALRAEYVRGFYLPIDQANNHYGPRYNDFRIRLVFGKSIPLGAGSR